MPWQLESVQGIVGQAKKRARGKKRKDRPGRLAHTKKGEKLHCFIEVVGRLLKYVKA